MEQPKIFLSYSLSKTPSKDTTAFVRLLKDAISKRGWVIIDPMVEDGLNSIREKVAQSLWEADAIFADVTACVPNVSFEVGFGTALGCPIVPFANKSIFDDLDEQTMDHWKIYFKIINHGKDKLLPTDMGDLQYFPYTNLTSIPERKIFLEDLDRVLDNLSKTWLTSSACFLRQSYKNFLRSVEKSAQYYSPSEHPFTRHLGGWLNHLNKVLKNDFPSGIELDAQSYQDCLAAFKNYKIGNANAIADLSSSTEPFWKTNPDPLSTAVSERVFVMNWSILYNRKQLSEKIELLKNQSKNYAVRVFFTPPIQRIEPFIFGDIGQALGHDLLLMEPNLVGGYIARQIGFNDERNYLRIQCNDNLYADALKHYTNIQEDSIEFRQDYTVNKLRQEWFKHKKIGDWNPDWSNARVKDRDNDYFDNYDMHIRSWIPQYDNLIVETIRFIQREIMNLLRTVSGGINLLEIGYGTGALTEPLLQWINTVNSPFLPLHEKLPISRYIAIDEAEQMEHELRRRLLVHGPIPEYFDIDHAEALDDFDKPPVSNNGPYHIIFGSLVIHDIFGDLHLNDTDNVDEFFRRCSDLLVDNGCIIFGDSFINDDNSQRDVQINSWEQWMQSKGLQQDQISRFIEGNQEMVNTVCPRMLKDVGAKYNFSIKGTIKYFKFSTTKSGRKTNTPFAVFVMQKDR